MEKQLMFTALVAMFLVAAVSAQSIYGEGSLDVGLSGGSNGNNTTSDTNAGTNTETGSEGLGLGLQTTVRLEADNSIYIEDDNSEILVTLDNSNLRAEVENNNLVIINAKGESTTVSITPQEAIVRAEAETGGECMEDCEVEIDEETVNAEERIVYEVTVEKKSKVFGYWDAEMDVEATVDAQTGQVIDIDRPWWFFLSSETRAQLG